jgi:hypothetical protein
MGVIRPPSSELERATRHRGLKLPHGEYQKRKFLLFWNAVFAVPAIFSIVIMSPQMRFRVLLAIPIALLIFVTLWKIMIRTVEKAEKEQRHD